MLIIVAILQKFYFGTTYKPGLNAATAFFFIYILVWGAFLDNTTYVYVPEIWPTHLRSHGAAIAYVAYHSVAIAITSPAALAFAQIGYKYYFVFVALCVSGSTFIWFQFPETAGLTLEEVGAKFGDEIEVTFEDALAHEMQQVDTDTRIEEFKED
ncbi:hypothetical protein A1O3_10471 [Capronia epimyces CBS 606.96]|uniref:Major facilitator superfamily (MFS) profile domain-containing protein n=1 Tax=Capronia epimyces CBS 606.96 TaxID=1182542 RepID=W9XIN8_9EURO|nr:uncharacterized protein A1O3_10471 [Capronia epimyces CBS 606.96]EXJ76826.1 hypothetical protein A1O3_10471 [Capronia epimyces CBS 606.96]